MPWSEEEIEDIIQRFNSEALLWLLIIHRGEGSTGVRAGTGKARNAVKLYGKVKAYAKSHGTSPPPDEKEIKQGYKRLLRVRIRHPSLGTASVVEGDKIDYLKLTRVGQRLVQRIHTEPSLKEFAKSEAGLDVDAEPEPKWPDEYNHEDAELVLTPREVVSDRTEPFQLPTHAEFDCEVCSKSLTNEYTFEYPTEAWTKYIEKTCGDCDARLRHKAGNPYADIDVIER